MNENPLRRNATPLTPEQVERIYYLRDNTEMSIAEISIDIGCPPQTVNNRLYQRRVKQRAMENNNG